MRTLFVEQLKAYYLSNQRFPKGDELYEVTDIVLDRLTSQGERVDYVKMVKQARKFQSEAEQSILKEIEEKKESALASLSAMKRSALYGDGTMEPFEYESLKFIYYDGEIAVVEKPSGMLSVPGKTEKRYCSTTIVRELCPGCVEFPSVHRLDMDTSGLLVYGLSKESVSRLSRQFIGRSVEKRYEALLEGVPDPEEGTVELPIGKDWENRPYMKIDWSENGKHALTRYRVLESGRGICHVLFSLETGRTHQLRIHSAAIGHPIVGDRLYGTAGERLMLHSTYLEFDHPVTGKRLAFSSPAPFADRITE